MMLCILESATGETLGYVNIARMDDERILQWLCSTGSYLSGGPYLMGSPEDYEITRCYPFAEGELVVIDIETQVPVLKLELPPELEQSAA